MSEQDFPSVLQAARLGADWAWTLLYREHAPAVLRYLRAHGAVEPEDLLGEVFVQVVRKIADFDGGEADFRAWVVTIARNRLADRWRSDSRRPVQPVEDEVLVRHAESGDAERDVMRRLGEQNVHAVLATLSRDQRDVIYLRVLVGLPIAETAAVMGKTEGAVKSLQVRALAAIRRAIAKKVVSL